MLITAAVVIVGAWGLAHLGMTSQVIPTLHPSSIDDRRVITMEWVNEGVTLVFLANLLTLIAFADPGSLTRPTLWSVVVVLNVLSVVSLATGARVHHVAYRMCPVIFTGSSPLIAAALLWP